MPCIKLWPKTRPTRPCGIAQNVVYKQYSHRFGCQTALQALVSVYVRQTRCLEETGVVEFVVGLK